MAILERLQSRTQIKARPVGKGHSKIGVAVRINRQLHNLDFLLSQHALNGGADLPFIEHDGLRIEDAPASEHMRVDPHGRCLATWIESCVPNTLSGLQTHHVGGGKVCGSSVRGEMFTCTRINVCRMNSGEPKTTCGVIHVDFIRTQWQTRYSGCRPQHALALGRPGSRRPAWNQVWLRHGSMRCVYDPLGWSSDTFLHHAAVGCSRLTDHHDRGPAEQAS